jgi:putative inorganic carbon (hco3(-)) transporter
MPIRDHSCENVRVEQARRLLLMLFFISFPFPIFYQQVTLGTLVGLLGWYCWQKRELPTTPLDRPLLLFFVAMLLSTLFCPDVLNSLAGYRKLWLVSAFLVTASLIRERKEVERLITLLVIAASVVAAYGIVQHYIGIDLNKQLRGKPPALDPYWFGRDEGWRTKGFHPSGITFAHNLLFPLTVVTVWLSGTGIALRQRLWLGLGWGLMVFALLFSLTRGVWLAYLAVLVLLGVIRGGRTLVGVTGGAIVLAGFLMTAGAGVQERLWSTFDFVQNLPRSQIWQANLDMIKTRPLLGWGYGNYRKFRDPFYAQHPEANHTGHAHNTFLQIAVDSGLLGLAAFLFFFWSLLRVGWMTYQHLPPEAEPLRSFILGALLSIVGFLVGGMTQHNFGDAEVVVVMWAISGVIARAWIWSQGASYKI